MGNIFALPMFRGTDLGPFVIFSEFAENPREFSRKQAECNASAEQPLAAARILRRYQFRRAQVRTLRCQILAAE
jgi:hypothetical protein